MLYFTRWKAAAILLTALVVCLLRRAEFLPRAGVKTWPAWAQRRLVLGLDLQGGSHLLLEVDHNDVRKEQARHAARRRAAHAARGPASAIPAWPCAATASRCGCARAPICRRRSTKLRELSQPLGGLLGANGQRNLDVMRCRRRADPPDAVPQAGDHRAHPPDHRSIDPDHRAARQRTRHSSSRLIQRQGTDRILVQVPGLQDPTPAEGTPRQDRQAGIPHGRYHRCRRSRRLQGTGAAGFRSADRGRRRPKIPYLIKKQVLVSGGDLTDAQPGFDQRTSEPIVSFRFNTSGARKFAAGDAGKCRPALRHRARQRGDLGAGDPRADPRRLRADFRQFHRAERQRSRDPAARRRAAGAADRDRGAHRRPGPRPGFDRQAGELAVLCRRDRW